MQFPARPSKLRLYCAAVHLTHHRRYHVLHGLLAAVYLATDAIERHAIVAGAGFALVVVSLVRLAFDADAPPEV